MRSPAGTQTLTVSSRTSSIDAANQCVSPPPSLDIPAPPRRMDPVSIGCGVVLPLVVVVVCTALGISLSDNAHSNSIYEERAQVSAYAEKAVQAISSATDTSLNAAVMLAGLVVGEQPPLPDVNGTVEQRQVIINATSLDSFGRRLASRYPSVASFQVQPSGIVTQAYPALTPGVKPHGHDLYNDPARRVDILDTIAQKEMAIGGPFPLIQGGVAMISRFPVFYYPANVSVAEFKTWPVERVMPYWWGMTASLVSFDGLLRTIDLPGVLGEGNVLYCLEYYNKNSRQVVKVAHDVGPAGIDAEASAEAGTLREDLEAAGFQVFRVALTGGRSWNLWTRAHTHSDTRIIERTATVLLSVLAGAVIAYIYWAPRRARLSLYTVLMRVFGEVMQLQLQPESIAERMPDDSPPAFVESLTLMVGTLDEYRKFIPQAVTGVGERASSPDVVELDVGYLSDSFSNLSDLCSAPGIHDGRACILFTDIRSSTKLWGACPKLMMNALRLHNTCIRELLSLYDGYEVKTIGDSFMIAYDKFEEAVACAMSIHRDLLGQRWPAELLALPECANDPGGMWRGVCLRIGIDEGEVEVEQNCLTRRYDYFGDVVNRAARLESVCPPGLVACRAELLEGASKVLEVDMSRDTFLFQAELRGFQGDVRVAACAPSELRGRLSITHAEWVRQHEAVRIDVVIAKDDVRSLTRVPTWPHPRGQGALFSAADSTTAACVRLADRVWTDNDPDTVNAVLAPLFDRLMATLRAVSAQVVGALHVHTLAVWRRRDAALRFAEMFQPPVVPGEDGGDLYSIGVASGGRLVSGVMGSGSAEQRYFNVLGAAVDLAVRLAGEAAEEELGVLVGVLPDNQGKRRGVREASYTLRGDREVPGIGHAAMYGLVQRRTAHGDACSIGTTEGCQTHGTDGTLSAVGEDWRSPRHAKDTIANPLLSCGGNETESKASTATASARDPHLEP